LNLAAGFVVGCILGSVVETGKWFELSGWGLVGGGWWMLRRWCTAQKWDFWEVYDWVSVMSLWFWFLGSVFYGPGAKYAMVSSAVGIIVTWFVRSHYRKFRWYPSGKVGIVGLSAILIYSVYEIVVAILNSAAVYWWGLTLAQTVGAWVIAICLVTVYLRGGNRFHTDVKMFRKK
jgi:hypothetical protein